MPPDLEAAPAIALEAGGRLIALKWHKLRRRREDPAFARANLETALAAGAAVEVDLVATADGDLVCLHEPMLEHETTGRGPVAQQPSATVLALRQRDNAGEPLDSLVLGLAELVQIVRSNPPPGRPDGRVQLDLKEPLAGITAEVVRRFAHALGDLGSWSTLSGPSWPAIERLRAAVPGLATGFDPEDAIAAGMAAHEVPGHLLETAPSARIYYLEHGFVLECLAQGRNPIAPLCAAGKRVECWTLDGNHDRVVEKLEALIAAGADQITTNDPERLAHLWRGRSGR
ncbi:MAG: glycerophosphodiester phosphodiesterase [Geminicoccaceae bacterium]